MNRVQIVRVFLVLGTILVSASALLFVGFLGSAVLTAAEMAPSPKPDKGTTIGPVDPSKTCEARYVAASKNPDYIVVSDCNNYNSGNSGKHCIRCNGKYEMDKQPASGGSEPGVASSFVVSCGFVEKGRCALDKTQQYLICREFYLTLEDCGDVTEYGRQPIVIIDPNQ